MAKIRVYQLAHDINKKAGEVVDILNQFGVPVKSHSSTIDDSVAYMVKQRLGLPDELEPEEETPPVEAAPEPAPTAEEPIVVEVVEEAPPEPAAEPEVAEPVDTAEVVTEAPPEAPIVEPEPEGVPADVPADAPEQRTSKAGRELINIPPTIILRDLAAMIDLPPADLISRLIAQGVMKSANQSISSDVASTILRGLGFDIEVQRETRDLEALSDVERERLAPVAPVVTVMGHVDHGKTTLLDAIRNTNVTEQEAGQITQHIGASEIEHNGKRIVFLDTPGHEAFTSMRARGAHLTDLALLVVAADDGIMPQTVEALNHARSASVPILVVINKIDRPDANADRVLQQLAEYELVPEDWGGDTVCVQVSALEGRGVDDLLEMIILVTEMQELKADPEAPAQGLIIEAHLDPQRGPTATILVQQGTLEIGQCVVAGAVQGRVRAMKNWRGEDVKQAGPSTPVTITGLTGVPLASDPIRIVVDSRAAKQQAATFQDEARAGAWGVDQRVSLEELFEQIQQGTVAELNLVVKADVQGSAEAICQALGQLTYAKVRTKVLHSAVGAINESDVSLAAASNAVIIGFHVGADVNARTLAEREHVEIRTYEIIYEVIEEIKAALAGLLEPVMEERVAGHAEVRALFRSSRAGTIAGCMVTDGRLIRSGILRVLRDDQEVFRGELSSLRHLTDTRPEVAAGMECGISVEGFNDFEEGDILECIELVEIARRLE